MKKYFAKYLPVEGEIKRGDYFELDRVNFPKTGIYKLENDEDASYEYEGEKYVNHIWNLSSNYQTKKEVNNAWRKVKLFLCSKDLQVGDGVVKLQGTVDEGTGVVLEVKSNSAIVQIDGMLDEDDNPVTPIYNLKNLTKVVGEISSEATWVKEGDEFNEEEIKHACGRTIDGNTIVCSQCNPVNNWEDCRGHVVKILGYCKHFH